MALKLNSDGESRFSIEDIFFTRTDERGIIASGNGVFQRVSVYEWNELINAPHKVVRHPDMPKAVFFLLWERLKAGLNIGAYVCNRAKDGTPYWVYAMAMPVNGGYLSVRIKPTSDILEKVVPLYNRLRQAENDEGLSADASANALHEAIVEMGFADYPDFMAHALDEEMMARNNALRMSGSETGESLKQMHAAVMQIEELAEKIKKIFHSTHQIPYNMRLQAGRLEASGGPISVISNNHRQMTQELESSLEEFCESAKVGHRSLLEAGFQNSLVQLLNEVHDKFQNDDVDRYFEKGAELRLLEELASQLHANSDDAISQVSTDVRKFGLKCTDIRRMMSGLELTRIMCKIERSKFDGKHDGLDEVVNRLAIAQEALGTTFDEINDRVRDILNIAGSLGTPNQRVA